MFRRNAALFLASASFVLICAPAHAEGFGGEVNYAHADGRDGAEVGAGYALSFQGFSLTPGAGLFHPGRRHQSLWPRRGRIHLACGHDDRSGRPRRG